MSLVLYVEDEPDDVFFLNYAWEEAGLDVPLVTVKDGDEAIDYLAGRGPFADREKHPLPCLVLLDLKLPVRSGFDVLQWIRRQPQLEGLEVVVLSGSEHQYDVSMAQSLGVTEYIVKPATPALLKEILLQRKALWFRDERG